MASISSEITRLENAKASIKSAIEAKGVTVGEGLLDTYAAKINDISSGGASESIINVYTYNPLNLGSNDGFAMILSGGNLLLVSPNDMSSSSKGYRCITTKIPTSAGVVNTTVIGDQIRGTYEGECSFIINIYEHVYEDSGSTDPWTLNLSGNLLYSGYYDMETGIVWYSDKAMPSTIDFSMPVNWDVIVRVGVPRTPNVVNSGLSYRKVILNLDILQESDPVYSTYSDYPTTWPLGSCNINITNGYICNANCVASLDATLLVYAKVIVNISIKPVITYNDNIITRSVKVSKIGTGDSNAYIAITNAREKAIDITGNHQQLSDGTTTTLSVIISK